MSLSHSLSSTQSPSTPSLATSQTPSGSPTQDHLDRRILILGITLVILSLLLMGCIVFVLRMKYHRSGDGFLSFSRRTVIEPRHPASRIISYGSRGNETPRFGYSHTPGSNMRLANRRSDGVWQFSELNSPLTPGDGSDLELSPSSFSSFHSSTTRLVTKEQEATVPTTPPTLSIDVEIAVDVPPPAYVYEHGTKG